MRDSRICNFDFLASNLDHGLLLGLGDDDHTQYLLADGSRDLTNDWVISTNGITLTNGEFNGIIGGTTPAAGSFTGITLGDYFISEASNDLVFRQDISGVNRFIFQLFGDDDNLSAFVMYNPGPHFGSGMLFASNIGMDLIGGVHCDNINSSVDSIVAIRVLDNSSLTGFGTLAKFYVDGDQQETVSLYPFRTAVGSAGAPSHSFRSDPDTGMYLRTANQIGFACAGSIDMFITTTKLFSQNPLFINEIAAERSHSAAYGQIWVQNSAGTNAGNPARLMWQDDADTETRIISDDDHYITEAGVFHSGDGTNEVQILADGDIVFVGTAGLPYGSFWGNEIAFVAAGGTGTYFEISDADIAVGQTNLTTFQNNKELAVTKAGVYKVAYSMSVKATGANKHIVGGIGVDAGGAGSLTIQNDGRNHAVSTGNAEFAISGTAILDLSASSEVGLMATNETDNTNVTVEHVTLSIIQVGGT